MSDLITRRTDNAYPGAEVSLSSVQWEGLAKRYFSGGR